MPPKLECSQNKVHHLTKCEIKMRKLTKNSIIIFLSEREIGQKKATLKIKNVTLVENVFCESSYITIYFVIYH